MVVRILCLNHKRTQCGVYEYGKRLFNIWKHNHSDKFEFVFEEIDTIQEYHALPFATFDAVVYNFHGSTMPWLRDHTIQRKCKNFYIPHECFLKQMDAHLDTQPDINELALPRPIFEVDVKTVVPSSNSKRDFIYSYTDTKIPIIGSFGFGFDNKGFDKIVQIVSEQYDEAVIKLLIPFAFFGDVEGHLSKHMANVCASKMTKPGIKLIVSHEYLTDEEVLLFLSKNTINMFLYDYMHGRGISSTIDYALSVNTPLMISDSYMFRHIYNDCICYTKVSIEECIKHSLEYLQQYKQAYSHKKCTEAIERILLKLLNKQ